MRRPPRGLPKSRFASDDWYDVWYPNLAALSKTASFSVGCYCEDESRFHRGLLRALLEERGANVAR